MVFFLIKTAKNTSKVIKTKKFVTKFVTKIKSARTTNYKSFKHLFIKNQSTS